MCAYDYIINQLEGEFNAIKTTAPIQGVLTLITEQSFLDKRIRVFGTPEDPLFLARDVAEWIDYSKRPDGSYRMDKMLQSVESEEKFKYLVPAYNKGGVPPTESGILVSYRRWPLRSPHAVPEAKG